MAHARETIRKAIAAALTGLATTAGRVSTSMVYPYDQDDLPALSIKVGREAQEYSEIAIMGSVDERELSVIIEGREKYRGPGPLEDTLDDIALEVETAMTTDATLKALVPDVILESTEIELDGGGDVPLGVVRMVWIISYRVNSTEPTAPV